jgi:RNA processing factor Prp31
VVQWGKGGITMNKRIRKKKEKRINEIVSACLDLLDSQTKLEKIIEDEMRKIFRGNLYDR